MSSVAQQAKFNTALCNIQKSIGTTQVSSTSFWDVCLVPLTQNEMAISQTVELSNGTALVTTTLSHVAGHIVQSTAKVAPEPGVRFGQLIEFYAFQNLIGSLGLFPPHDSTGTYPFAARERS